MTKHKTQTKKTRQGLIVTYYLLREGGVLPRTAWYQKEHQRRWLQWKSGWVWNRLLARILGGNDDTQR